MKSSLQDIETTAKRFSNRFGYEKKKPVKEMSMREMVGIMRKLNEDDTERPLSQSEIDREQEKFLNYFATENVDVSFQPLEVSDNKGVFWGGTINNGLTFTYELYSPEVLEQAKSEGKDLKNEATVNYLDGFDPRDPNNDKIVKMIQSYYNDFYKYWRDNALQLDI